MNKMEADTILHLGVVPSRLRPSQLISWAHSPHTVLQPTFVPWLLSVNKCERLVHFRNTNRSLILDCEGLVVSGAGGGMLDTTDFRSVADSSGGTRCTSSHSNVLWNTSQAMSCSSFDSFSSSFSCRRVSCSW